MGAGFNKLIEEWKNKQNSLKEKLRFVIKALTDKDASFTLMAYNGLKQRAMMLNGVGLGDSEMKKIQLIKRLTNQGYNLQVMAANALKEFLVSERSREKNELERIERENKEKERILRRILDANLRFAGLAFRQAKIFTNTERDRENLLIIKKRSIIKRIIDSNVRLMGKGFTKLIEEWKNKQNTLREKLRFVIKALTDKDASFTLMAYNGLKQRSMMLKGVGLGDSEMKKIQLIKRLTNQGYNLQVMAANALKQFLVSERLREESERIEHERQQKEKDRILRRIMDSNVRMMGTGFRQSFQFMESEREKERALILKQRGIMRRIVDKNARMVSAGYNKLIEEWKVKQNILREKLRFVIKALTDTDSRYILQSYNSLKERQQLLNGVGVGNAGMMKIQLIKRLTSQGFNLQCLVINSLKEYLKSQRYIEEKLNHEADRIRKEQEKICKRLLHNELNLLATAFRLLKVNYSELINKERILAMKQRGICRRIIDSNVRLAGLAFNQIISFYKQCLLEAEAKANISNMRNSMLDKMFKGREAFEKRQFESAFGSLSKWNQLCNTKQAIIKNMFRKMLGKNDSVLMYAFRNLTENHIKKKTFDKCKS